MHQTTHVATFTPARDALLRTLLYFDIFRYPLSLAELRQYLPGPAPALEEVLAQLLQSAEVFEYQGFYLLHPRPEWVQDRLACNRRADVMLPRARRMAQLIGRFPFVRTVCVSGSLSKHCMKPDSDIDFFIITEPGRLWLARTLLVLFKKIFLLNSHKYFCVNYFVDTEHLDIEEKNLFTATEIVTLLPLYGAEMYHQFMEKNAWVRGFYPFFPLRSTAGLSDKPLRPWYQRVAEALLRTRAGSWLDAAALRLTLAFWRRKFRHITAETFEVALKSRRYVSKHHPLFFQEKVLKAYAERLQQIQNNY
jgi:predicted nucleotidyltransferase